MPTVPPLTDRLEQLEALARELGQTDLATAARAAQERYAQGLFYVALVGEFKRGKSTLINALVETPVLPAGVVPVTAVPTVIRFGPLGARVREDGSWRAIPLSRVADFVSQEENPGNSRGVSGVEVTVPHPLLGGGLCLVDTPGLGSVHAENTKATRDFLPHIDAAVVMLGAAPPISADELEFVTALRSQVETLIFVLGKADQIPPGDRAQAEAFTRQVLKPVLGDSPRTIYQITAMPQSRVGALAVFWTEFRGALMDLAAASGARLSAAGACRGADRVRAQLGIYLEEARRALRDPLEAADRRARELADLAAGAERAGRELAPLLALEEQRLGDLFRARRIAFLERVLPEAAGELAERLAGARRCTRGRAVDLANELARERLAAWLVASEREATRAYDEAMARFSTLAAEYLARLAHAAGVAERDLELDPTWDAAFSAQAGFYFANLMYRARPSSVAALFVDHVLPKASARRRNREWATRYLVDLLTVNAERVENDLRERVRQSERNLRAALGRVLADVGRAATQGAEAGRRARTAGEAASRESLARIDRQRRTLAALDGRPAAAVG